MVEFAGELMVELLNTDGDVLWREPVRNAATLEGLTAILQDFFAAGTQKTQWFLGLINGSGYTGVSASDTMSSHAGWTELTSYTSGTRPQWTPLSAASGIIANTSQVTLTITSACTVKGFFVVSNSTKGASTGVLWATALFATARTLSAGNGLRLTYTVRASGGSS